MDFLKFVRLYNKLIESGFYDTVAADQLRVMMGHSLSVPNDEIQSRQPVGYISLDRRRCTLAGEVYYGEVICVSTDGRAIFLMHPNVWCWQRDLTVSLPPSFLPIYDIRHIALAVERWDSFEVRDRFRSLVKMPDAV